MPERVHKNSAYLDGARASVPEYSKVDKIMESYSCEKSALIAILQEKVYMVTFRIYVKPVNNEFQARRVWKAEIFTNKP